MCLWRESLTIESALEKLSYGEDASSGLRAIVEQLDHFLSLSHQVINDFGDISEKVKDLRFKVSKIKLLLNTLTKELINLQNKFNVQGDAQDVVEQDVEQHNT